MKKINLFIAIFAIAILLSITALSQEGLNSIVNIATKSSQITPKISLEEKETCTTAFYEDARDIIGNCAYYDNHTYCSNASGPDTECSFQQTTSNFQCKTGESIIQRNRTECKPDNKFVILIDQGTATLKKQIDYSDWGPCIYAQESINGNSCLVVTCVSLYDGAHLGKFTDCNGGKSCQKFEICENSIRTFYKNSREDFVEYDGSFYLPELGINEAEE